MTAASARWRRQRLTIGFVPTMGALHAGHLSLIQRARRETDRVVVSIFVNPLQFGPQDDFRRYPRPLARDLRLAHRAGADAVFAPSVSAMYPPGHVTTVRVARLTEGLCGAFRPGHFDGVATVVARLLHLVRPDVMYLGQKDAQQAVVIRRLVRDLGLPVKVTVLPTVREPDGLAMSSRNRYLTSAQRRQAPALYQALAEARARIRAGERRPGPLIRRMRQRLRRAGCVPQYVACVDAEELQPVRRLRGRVLLAAAAWLGRTRLIDNLVVSL